ncbi:protein C21orf2-like [Ctenocephalides felis]|uniref:protein C21orf2-like n=1 Tax=Ctenocephalides felis TaxID=7515 RepID=UPI000E6E14C6|nr:protein C21orf2-like [Ctenocephalides felis]
MARLTSDMVSARTKQCDIGSVKKLNCWGTELEDVSILRSMPSVEILALSINKISRLIDFEECWNLQELYLRQNKIADLNELCYLQNLPKLKKLWLEENPCAQLPNYRLIVLRTLPNLVSLDNVPFSEEEIQAASRSKDHYEIEEQVSEPESNHYEESEEEQPEYVSHHPQQQTYNNQYQTRNRPADTRPVRPQSVNMSASASRQRLARSPGDSESSSPSPRTSPRMETPEEPGYQNWRKHETASQWSTNSEHYRPHDPALSVTNQVIGNHLKGFQRRPVARNSNLLSAVLCLVKELDYQSLEVLELAVRCRMDEIAQQ